MFSLSSIVSLYLVLSARSAFANSCHDSKPIEIIKDVAIIGGGASGTYAAVRLREDFNTSIVLVEPQPILGGHTNTYRVPNTNTTLNYGVQAYLPYGPALNFFARFGIPTQPSSVRRLTALNVDVETGETLKDYVEPSANATAEAFQRWLAITSKYKDLLEPGYWNFPLPSDIPPDFLVPFGEFARKHQIEAAVPRIVIISGVGYGGVQHILTLNVFQAFGASLTKDLLDGTLFQPVGYNGILYERALQLLRSDVLLSSTVQNAVRTPEGVELSVKQGDVNYIIKARRVLYTAGPSLNNLAPFHPDAKESATLSTWTPVAELVGMIKAPCLPENYSITYLPNSVVPSNQLALKDWPYSLTLESAGPFGLGLFRVVFGANYTMMVEEIKDLVVNSIKKIQDAGTIPGRCKAEFKAVSDHARPQWKQSAELLKAGFVQDLYALQGYRNMWYTGYAWAAPYSSTVWAFTDTVIDRLLKDLKG